MSHVSCINVDVKDLDALNEVAKELGLELVRNQSNYKWYGTFVNDYHGNDAAYKHGLKPEMYGKCEHALRIPGDSAAYEIGVVKTKNGYKLVWDFYGTQGGKLRKRIGEKGEKLLQGYAKEVAVKALAKKGFKVQKIEKVVNGAMKITLRG
jgi:hypothetical protein